MRQRRLAAIMFTDIVGYTAMMQENEHAAATLRQRHRDILQSAHQHYHGEVLQYYGDGTLSVFNSAVEAVECAVAMQQQFQTGEIVPLRVGIHLGDIVFDDEEVYGDGVNLASRIESLGVPGCVLISDKVHSTIKSQPSIQTQSLGYFEFKNITDPVEVFSVRNQGLRIPERSALQGKLKQNKKSIAVLPFVNMSSDPENEYFSDGIAEEILNALVRVEGLQVTARTSSFAFKGKNMDVREIGSQLGVTSILEGSVRKAGNRVRITAQLVSTVDGYHFFSETYDRSLEDIFAVQDEVARKIVLKLKASFEEKVYQKPLVHAPVQNLELYEKYLKAVYLYNQWTPDGVNEALALVKEVVSEEPGYLDAWIIYGASLNYLRTSGLIPLEESLSELEQIFLQIDKLDENNPFKIVSAAQKALFVDWDLKAAKALAGRAYHANGNDPWVHHVHAVVDALNGDFGSMKAFFEKSLELDPLNPIRMSMSGWGYYYAREYDKAEEILLRALRIQPVNRPCLELMGLIRLEKRRFDEALQYFHMITSEMGLRLMKSACMGYAYGLMGETVKANACLKTIRDLQSRYPDGMYGINLALVHLGKGDLEPFFAAWEVALENRSPTAYFYFEFPPFADHRANPRYVELKEKYFPRS
jgi:TolB-like protein/class 3 adenylate cyclase